MRSLPDSILLCGGAGLRLRSVIGGAPKGMASVDGRPFLELLLRQLRRNGFKRAILAVGYQQDVIESHFGKRALDLDLVYSREFFPLGTGGALRNAVDLVQSDNVLVMNGDSYTDVNLGKFVSAYHEAKADASVVVVPADGRSDCGFAVMNADGMLTGFEEKKSPLHAAYVNAGIYLLSRAMLKAIPPNIAISIERELIPGWLHQHRLISGRIYSGACLDIGTPDRYRDAQTLLAGIEAEAPISQSEGQQ